MAIHDSAPMGPIRVYEFLDTLTDLKFALWSLDARLRTLASAHPTDSTIADLAGDAQRMADKFEQWQIEHEQPDR